MTDAFLTLIDIIQILVYEPNLNVYQTFHKTDWQFSVDHQGWHSERQAYCTNYTYSPLYQ